MKLNNYKLKTTFNMGLELNECILGGKKITRNILGFNITLHFKTGVCKIIINNIEKINIMVHLDEIYRNINFEDFNNKESEKLEFILNKIKNEIRKKFYSNVEVYNYNTKDLNECGSIILSRKL